MTSKREKKKKSIIYRGNFSKARDVGERFDALFARSHLGGGYNERAANMGPVRDVVLQCLIILVLYILIIPFLSPFVAYYSDGRVLPFWHALRGGLLLYVKFFATAADYLVTAVVFLARSVSTAALYLPVAALCLMPIGAMLGVLLLPAVLLLATVWSVTMHEITTASLFPSVSTYITYLIDHFLLISPILALDAFKPGSLGLLSQRAYAVPILLVYFTCAAFDIGLPQLLQAIPNTINWLAAAPTRVSSALDAHSELKIRRTEVQLLREQVEEAHKKLAEAEAKARGEK